MFSAGSLDAVTGVAVALVTAAAAAGFCTSFALPSSASNRHRLVKQKTNSNNIVGIPVRAGGATGVSMIHKSGPMYCLIVYCYQ